MDGFQANFLGDHHSVSLPQLTSELLEKVAYLKDSDDFEIKYYNFSVVLDKLRKFPFFTASNTDGSQFISIPREDLFNGSDRWKKDTRIASDQQWGMELYSADKSDFHRGHMTKREDVQWGASAEAAAEGARSTFYFTNSVPQHAKVNGSIWRSIEDYILKNESVKKSLNVSILTGPVLQDDDPFFVTKVNAEKIRLPILFWKVVYYVNKAGVLSKVGFLVGQRYLLQKSKVIKRRYRRKTKRSDFMEYKHADTYQVDTKIIEELTGLKFSAAATPFSSDEPVHVVKKKVNVVRRGEQIEEIDEYSLIGLTL